MGPHIVPPPTRLWGFLVGLVEPAPPQPCPAHTVWAGVFGSLPEEGAEGSVCCIPPTHARIPSRVPQPLWPCTVRGVLGLLPDCPPHVLGRWPHISPRPSCSRAALCRAAPTTQFPWGERASSAWLLLLLLPLLLLLLLPASPGVKFPLPPFRVPLRVPHPLVRLGLCLPPTTTATVRPCSGAACPHRCSPASLGARGCPGQARPSGLLWLVHPQAQRLG